MRFGQASGGKEGAFFVAIGSNLLLSACGIVTGILLARLLGPVERGELAAVTLWPIMILTQGGLGIPHTTAYFVAIRREETGKIYVNSLLLAFFQCLLLIIIGLLLIPIVLRSEYAHAIPLSLAYLMAIPLSLVAGVHTGILQGRLAMKSHSLQRIVPMGVYLLGVGILFLFEVKSLVVVVGLLLLQLIVAVSLGLWILPGKIPPPYRLDKNLLAEMVRYGLKIQVGHGASALNLRLDQLVMSIFLAPQSLGYYVVAATFSGAITPVSNAVETVTLPLVAAERKQMRQQRVLPILRKNMIVLCSFSVILMVLIPWLVPLLFGAQFVASIIPAQILIAGTIFVGMNEVLSAALRGMDRPGVPALAQVISLIATALLLFILLPRYGIIGAAIASVIAYGSTFVIMVAYLTACLKANIRTLFPTSADWKELLAAVHY